MATPEAISKLELLVASRVMDLRAISDVVSGDPGLKAQVIYILRETDATSTPLTSLEGCVVELGREGMRECLHRARSESKKS